MNDISLKLAIINKQGEQILSFDLKGLDKKELNKILVLSNKKNKFVDLFILNEATKNIPFSSSKLFLDNCFICRNTLSKLISEIKKEIGEDVIHVSHFSDYSIT